MPVPWMKVLDTVGGLVQLSTRFRKDGAETGLGPSQPPGGGGGPLEARLAGVVVAALQEAFDRDRVRMELERSQVEAEQKRAAEALAAELRRQMSERALGQLRLISIVAVATWMLSAALAVWLPGMRDLAPRVVLGAGWTAAFAAIGCAFAGWQRISEWTAAAQGGADGPPKHAAAAAAPLLLLLALALTAASLLLALSRPI